MDLEGQQRLLSALGPSLEELWLNFPNKAETSSAHTGSLAEYPLAADQPNTVSPWAYLLSGKGDYKSLELYPSSHPNLKRLTIYLTSFPRNNRSIVQSLRDTLISWVDQSEDVVSTPQCLELRPDRNGFTREEFVGVLHTIGPVVEEALCGPQAESDFSYYDEADSQPYSLRVTLSVANLGDTLEREYWWNIQVAECFPTLFRQDRLHVYPTHNGASVCALRAYGGSLATLISPRPSDSTMENLHAAINAPIPPSSPKRRCAWEASKEVVSSAPKTESTLSIGNAASTGVVLVHGSDVLHDQLSITKQSHCAFSP